MIPQFTDGGLLPVGRFQCSMDEVHSCFVAAERFATSTTRADVWNRIGGFLAEMAHLRARIPAMFLGGSFISGNVDPDDGDLSPLIDMSRIQSDNTRRAIFQAIANSKAVLNLDIFPIRWVPEDISRAQGLGAPGVEDYLKDRGQWDDFWQRQVPHRDRSAFVRSHAFPVRGYLEVIVDGYR